MKKSHLATAAFWIGLLTLCAQGAAQIPQPPRPPLPIPNVVALMPPVARHLPSQPTPIPPPTPAANPDPATAPDPAASPGVAAARDDASGTPLRHSVATTRV